MVENGAEDRVACVLTIPDLSVFAQVN
jgi:hypothetical protein